jgi:hypothetical protein
LIVSSVAQGKGDDDNDVDMEFFESQTDLETCVLTGNMPLYWLILVLQQLFERFPLKWLDAIEISIVDCALQYDCT